MKDKEKSPKSNISFVEASEAGMKLIIYLKRHLMDKHRNSELHKWLRTGQLRLNKKRAKAFELLQEGDEVRFPPFASLRDVKSGSQLDFSAELDLGRGLALVSLEDNILVLNKDSGLAVQGGTGIDDSLVDRLRKAFAKAAYIPAPAHRLDRNSSGLILAGLSHEKQLFLHGLFKNDQVHKEYLAWVQGHWSYEDGVFEDWLVKDSEGKENMLALQEPSEKSKLARAEIKVERYIKTEDYGFEASLLKIRLISGRTHQIRVQLSSRGYPIIGDARYGGPIHYPMLLHCSRIKISEELDFTALPCWEKNYNVL